MPFRLYLSAVHSVPLRWHWVTQSRLSRRRYGRLRTVL